MKTSIKIDKLIEIVRNGGVVRTGVDVFNSRGMLLIEKSALLKSVSALLTLKQNGLLDVPVDYEKAGGLWDEKGKLIETKKEPVDMGEPKRGLALSEAALRVKDITQFKKEARVLHQRATENMKKVMEEIKKTGGKFDKAIIEITIDEIFVFLARKGNVFSSLAKELFTYDDYLYNHSVSVCTLGTAILLQFNEQFGELVNAQLNQTFIHNTKLSLTESSISYILYYPEELKDIAMGMFLHDVGKILISEEILNKEGRLTPDETKRLESHSYELGADLLKKNGIHNALINNVVKYHHSALYRGETKAYPEERLPIEIPPYVKICKLVDLYDSRTSNRLYKDAESPVHVVTDIFRRYAGKEDIMLQLVLHAFVSVVGIYPAGSVVYLRNGQMAYVADSKGPICIPFTDRYGNPVPSPQEPFDASSVGEESIGLHIDRRRPPLSPKDTYEMLPGYLKEP